MKARDFARLSLIIFSILILSLVIGDLVITPIVIYHKLLVRFFGIFFLFLGLFLFSAKIYSNYIHQKTYEKTATTIWQAFGHTLKQTLSQIFFRTAKALIFIGGIFLIGFVSFFLIWANSLLFKIQAY